MFTNQVPSLKIYKKMQSINYAQLQRCSIKHLIERRFNRSSFLIHDCSDVGVACCRQVARRLYDLGCYEISLGDTIGVGTPASVGAMISAVKASLPVECLGIHCHDTYGQAVANVFAALMVSGQLRGRHTGRWTVTEYVRCFRAIVPRWTSLRHRLREITCAARTVFVCCDDFIAKTNNHNTETPITLGLRSRRDDVAMKNNRQLNILVALREHLLIR